MGRAPCCDKANVKKGPWSLEEDSKLKSYIEQHGTGGNWIALPQKIETQLPGRTDYDIKNYWNRRLKKKFLGKQRKEQVRRVSNNLKQEMKRETENLMVSSASGIQPPYWTPQYSIPVPNNISSIQQCDLTNQTSFLNNKLPSGAGIRFSLQDHQQPYTITPTTTINSQDACGIPSTQDQPYNKFEHSPSEIVLINIMKGKTKIIKDAL
ncbi:SANT/Myb domain [Sesbania bispinosa]|nr:SANT/Myb domain [Sesbania bispinosa]